MLIPLTRGSFQYCNVRETVKGLQERLFRFPRLESGKTRHSFEKSVKINCKKAKGPTTG